MNIDLQMFWVKCYKIFVSEKSKTAKQRMSKLISEGNAKACDVV